MAQMASVVLLSALPLNGDPEYHITIRWPFEWRQWRVLMATIIGATGAIGPPLAPFVDPIGANGANGAMSISIRHFSPNSIPNLNTIAIGSNGSVGFIN
jgi:hypothetical protein